MRQRQAEMRGLAVEAKAAIRCLGIPPAAHAITCEQVMGSGRLVSAGADTVTTAKSRTKRTLGRTRNSLPENKFSSR